MTNEANGPDIKEKRRVVMEQQRIAKEQKRIAKEKEPSKVELQKLRLKREWNSKLLVSSEILNN